MQRSIVGEIVRSAPHLATAPFSAVLHHWQRLSNAAVPDQQPAAAAASKELLLLNSHAHNNWIIENSRYTSAHFAAHCDAVPLMRLLRDDLHVSLVEPDGFQSLPMHYAAREGNLDSLEYLVSSCGSDIRAVDEKKRNCAHLACAGGHPKVLELIDRHQLLVELCDKEDSMRLIPVHVAASYGNDDCLRTCALAGVNITAVDSLQRHSVMYAAEQGRVNILAFFAEEVGPSVLLARDKFVATCAHYAARQGQTEVLSFLAAHGVDLDSLDKNGRTPAFWAVLGGKTKAHIEAIQFLRQHGADMDLRDSTGSSLLDVALSKYSRETNIVKFLAPIVSGKIHVIS